MKILSVLSGLLYGLISMVFLPVILVNLNSTFQLPTFQLAIFKLFGLLSVIGGGILLVYSTRLFAKFGKGGSPLPFDPPNYLVTTGSYKYIRNPMFTASALIWFGEFLFFGSLLLLPYAIGWVLFNHIHLITQDEKWLEIRFGKKYLDYKNKTPRYIPFILQKM